MGKHMKNYMSKKWLYSVAAGALLIAGQAAGITVHDVLSNGFWSSELRQTEESLNAATTDNYKEKYKNEKTETQDYFTIKSYLYIKKAQTTDGIKWKQKQSYSHAFIMDCVSYEQIKQTIKATCSDYKEQIASEEQYDQFSDDKREAYSTDQTYSFKRRKKNARPVQPFIPNNATNWFSDTLGQFPHGNVFLEHVATTNITSDSIRITGRYVAQSTLDKYELGLLDPGKIYPPGRDSVDVYDKYNYEIAIQVAKNKVYVERTVTEDTLMTHNIWQEYKTKYIASFNKKGYWKKSTEDVTSRYGIEPTSWYKEYQKQQERE